MAAGFCNLNDVFKGLPQVNQTQWWIRCTLLGIGQPKSFQIILTVDSTMKYNA